MGNRSSIHKKDSREDRFDPFDRQRTSAESMYASREGMLVPLHIQTAREHSNQGRESLCATKSSHLI